MASTEESGIEDTSVEDPRFDPVSGLEFPWKKHHAGPPPKDWFLKPAWFDFVYNTADSDLRAHRIALTYYNLATK